MKQVVQNYKTGEFKVTDVPTPALKAGFITVKNVNSFVSVGTEKLMIDLAKKSLLGKALARPDLVKRVIEKVKTDGISEAYRQSMNRLDDMVPLGYSSAGEVLEVGLGAGDFKVGDRVACFGSGFASHAEYVSVPKNLCVKVPKGVDYESASFAAIGAIALHGVRLANLTLGERVAVIGLGLLGQITIQILKAQGCSVFGVDIEREKIILGKEHGLDDGTTNDEDVRGAIDNFTKGRGVDAVIVTASTKSNNPLDLAAEISREKGRIIAVGLVGLNIPRNLFFEKELDFVVSRGAGPGIFDERFEVNGLDYPLPYVRWTENRNMSVFLELIAKGKVSLEKIITHRFEIGKALDAYNLILSKNNEKFIGILLSYGGGGEEEKKIVLKDNKRSKTKENANIGLIGAGLFARTTILPAISKSAGVNVVGVATATGSSSRHVADKFGFDYCTSNYEDLLNDADIDTILIATRHNLHAKLVTEALEKDKNIFCEKPLAVSEAELKTVYAALKDSKGNLMVGFNRRFSPLAVKAKEWIGEKCTFVVNIRVNAGYIEKESWVHGAEGGGRIIGEICHFVDLIQYFTESNPISVYAQSLSGETGKYVSEDNVTITLKLKNGSIGNITYVSNGDKAYSRERIEIFGGGAVCVLDNFKDLYYTKDGKSKRVKKRSINMGHSEEFNAFFKAIKEGTRPAENIESYLYTSIATFKIIQSLKERRPLDVSIESVI